ncbi:hypothetical protein ACROYT_G025624 [Oculina patagonica]
MKEKYTELKNRQVESEEEESSGQSADESDLSASGDDAVVEEDTSASDSDLPEEPDWATLEDNASAGSSTESEEDDDHEEDSRNYVRVESGKATHEEPKFILFFSMLMSLFSMFFLSASRINPLLP